MKNKDLLNFTRLLSSLLNSGLVIGDAVMILEESASESSCTTLAANLKASLEEGFSFYASMKKSEPDLPPFYLQLLAIGEESGDLRLAVYKLNLFLSKRLLLKDKFINSALYPLIVLIISFASLFFIGIFVIPKITDIYSSIGVPLSPGFSFSISAVKMLSIIIPVGVLSLLLLTITFRLSGNRDGRSSITKRWLKYSLPLKLPFAGEIIKTVHLFYILQSLETLTTCGATVVEAIGETAGIYTIPVLQNELKNIELNLRRGMKLSVAFSKSKIFPKEIAAWTALGEKTGKTAEVFGQLATFYEKKLEKMSIRFMKLIEPVLIIFTGLLLLGMVYFIIIPIFTSFGQVLQ